MTAADAPAVPVADDNAGVRTSIQALLKSVRLRCSSFGPAKEHPPPHRHEDAEM
jgi:FixJ family two-component response regulator